MMVFKRSFLCEETAQGRPQELWEVRFLRRHSCTHTIELASAQGRAGG